MTGYETVASEPLAPFTWVGEEYVICRVNQKHTGCDARWYEYYAYFFGYEYHDRHISNVLQTLGRRCDDIPGL